MKLFPLLLLVLLSSCVTEPKAPTARAPTAEAQPADAKVGHIVHSGKCLDISGASRDNYAVLQQWDCNGTEAQSFRFQDTGDGHFRIVNTNSNKCLDVSAGSTARGARLLQYDCHDGNNQRFRFLNNGLMQVKHSGLCLDTNDWSKENGAAIIQWDCHGGDNQRFTWSGGTNSGGNPGPGGDDWRLVWSDEFDGSSLDGAKWNYEVWRPGVVNHELQNYTYDRRENVRVEGGRLIIEARRDWFQGAEYSSGRIKTQGKASWTYGKIEARIKLPGGFGTWPAFWMMPDNQSRGWPACGELDIMENVGYDFGTVVSTIHNGAYNWPKGTQKSGSTGINPNDWHTYTVEWFPDHIESFVDGRSYFRFNNENRGDDFWAYDKNFHIILNLAVGGDWGAAKGVDPNIWPRRMEVDYVRVFKK